LLKKRHMHNKEDKAFLLVELRIAIQRDPNIAFMCPCVMTHVDSTLTDLYTDPLLMITSVALRFLY
jgi:hypothetical protein